MNPQPKLNACHIHHDITQCLVKEQAIREISLKMRCLRVLNLRYLSLEPEMPDNEANIYIIIPLSGTRKGLHHVDMNITSFTDVACVSKAQVTLT